MAITRNQWLASSHRYIGDTSAPWLVTLALALLVVSIAAWAGSLRWRLKKYQDNEPIWMIRIAMVIFTAIAGVTAIGLSFALYNAYLETPRPDAAKPFFETLARWSSVEELESLKRVFAGWDVDTFAMNRWLAPLMAVSMLLGGHAFLRLQNRKLGWSITVSVALVAVMIALKWNPLDRFYHGSGMTSQQTVNIFFWLNVLLVGAIYLLVSAIGWSFRGVAGAVNNRVYRACIGCIHGGAVVALIAVITATVLDSYVQSVFIYPEDFKTPKRLPDGYSVMIDLDEASFQADGGRGDSGQAFRAVSSVDLHIDRAGAPLEIVNGKVIYRHDQKPLEGETGPVRQLCQVLDYRYARYVSGPTYIVDPFIHRSIWHDTQLWVSPVFEANSLSAAHVSNPVQATIVIRSYPLLSGLWIGLVATLAAALVLTFQAWRGRGVT